MRNLMLVLFTTLITGSLSAQDVDPKWTEKWEPVPPVVTPGTNNSPPSDAIVLFDGSNFDEWEAANGGPMKWKLEDGAMVVVKGSGYMQTKRKFGDIQLHIEWKTPEKMEGKGQGRGNSGVYLQGQYEVQVLDSYNNPTYVNGQAAAVYKQHIPLVNASRKPGEWQTYDIIYTAPRFREDGRLFSPATVTVLHNGVLVQNHVTIMGLTDHKKLPEYTAHGKLPLKLQDHSNPVAYRNIWVREL